jgi:hypothetical protein
MASIGEIIRHVHEMYHFRADLKQWAAAVAPLRAGRTADKSLLISNLHHLYGSSKFETLLAAALRRLGNRSVVVLPSRSRQVEALHNAVGETEFH